MSETILRKLRIENNLSQSELAKISGVNYRTLQDFEQGRKSISNAKGEMIYRLSVALGCTPDTLIEDKEIYADIMLNKTDSIKHIGAYREKLSESVLYGKYYRFPVIIKNDHIDMSRIYPTKQRLVSNIFYKLSPDERIVSIMLFGSSITMKCHKDSDTDLAVRLKDNCVPDEAKNSVSEAIQEICDWKADILWFDRINPKDRVYQDICRGVQIL